MVVVIVSVITDNLHFEVKTGIRYEVQRSLLQIKPNQLMSIRVLKTNGTLLYTRWNQNGVLSCTSIARRNDRLSTEQMIAGSFKLKFHLSATKLLFFVCWNCANFSIDQIDKSASCDETLLDNSSVTEDLQ